MTWDFLRIAKHLDEVRRFRWIEKIKKKHFVEMVTILFPWKMHYLENYNWRRDNFIGSYSAKSNRWIDRRACTLLANLACRTVMVQTIQHQPSNGMDSNDSYCRSPSMGLRYHRDTNRSLSDRQRTVDLVRFARFANDRRYYTWWWAHHRLAPSIWDCCWMLLKTNHIHFFIHLHK